MDCAARNVAGCTSGLQKQLHKRVAELRVTGGGYLFMGVRRGHCAQCLAHSAQIDLVCAECGCRSAIGRSSRTIEKSSTSTRKSMVLLSSSCASGTFFADVVARKCHWTTGCVCTARRTTRHISPASLWLGMPVRCTTLIRSSFYSCDPPSSTGAMDALLLMVDALAPPSTWKTASKKESPGRRSTAPFAAPTKNAAINEKLKFNQRPQGWPDLN